MNEPLHFSPGQNFDCSLCGKCCGGWRVLVDDASAARIRGSQLELRVIQETGKPALKRSRGHLSVAQTAQGKCVFLNPQQLCGVHAELGSESKPTGCHKFPFQFCRTPDGVYVGVSFYCSAAQQNHGRPLSHHGPIVTRLLDEVEPLDEYPLPVHGRITMSWDAYRSLEKRLASHVTSNLEGALAGLSSLVARAGRRWSLFEADDIEGMTPGMGIDAQAPPLRAAYVSLLGHLEVATAGKLPAFTQALLQDQPRCFRRFNHWTGTLSALDQAGPLPKWASDQLERYLQALLFRKFLVCDRPVLHNLALLYLLPRLFAACSHLSRFSRRAPSLEPVDIYRAFDECEYTYMTHATGLEETLADLGQILRRQFI